MKLEYLLILLGLCKREILDDEKLLSGLVGEIPNVRAAIEERIEELEEISLALKAEIKKPE